jgi:hypothetical protein
MLNCVGKECMDGDGRAFIWFVVAVKAMKLILLLYHSTLKAQLLNEMSYLLPLTILGNCVLN